MPFFRDHSRKNLFATILYAMLALLLIAATVADAVPGIAIYMTLLAGAAMVLGTIALLHLARMEQLNDVSAVPELVHIAPLELSSRRLIEAYFRRHAAELALTELALAEGVSGQRLSYAKDLELLVRAEKYGHLQRAFRNPTRSVPSELKKYRLSDVGEQSFTIDAGAFTIQHFHGKTNIRVSDSDLVTIERADRDVTTLSPGRSEGEDFDSPTYN